jgi:hypothetical protein
MGASNAVVLAGPQGHWFWLSFAVARSACGACQPAAAQPNKCILSNRGRSVCIVNAGGWPWRRHEGRFVKCLSYGCQCCIVHGFRFLQPPLPAATPLFLCFPRAFAFSSNTLEASGTCNNLPDSVIVQRKGCSWKRKHWPGILPRLPC